jgi:hypothetical protein
LIVTLYFRRFKVRNPFKASHSGWQQTVLAKEKVEKEAAEKFAKKVEKRSVRALLSLHPTLLQALKSVASRNYRH